MTDIKDYGFSSFTIMAECLPSTSINCVEDMVNLKSSNRGLATCKKFISAGWNAFIFDYAKSFQGMADPTDHSEIKPFRVIRDFMLPDDFEKFNENDVARVLIDPVNSLDCEVRAVGNACIRMMGACMEMEQKNV